MASPSPSSYSILTNTVKSRHRDVSGAPTKRPQGARYINHPDLTGSVLFDFIEDDLIEFVAEIDLPQAVVFM
jgi:hypothetical protein